MQGTALLLFDRVLRFKLLLLLIGEVDGVAHHFQRAVRKDGNYLVRLFRSRRLCLARCDELLPSLLQQVRCFGWGSQRCLEALARRVIVVDVIAFNHEILIIQ